MERGIRRPGNGPEKQKRQGANYVLAIGIDRYEHWTPLHNAVKDVEDFLQTLVHQYQFDEAHLIRLYDEQATENGIYQAFRELRRKITENDNLLVYYSGHGHYDEEFDEGYWVPVDARRDAEDRYISNANIIKRLNAIPTHHTLLIVDSCFSGSLVVRKRSVTVDERFRSRRIIASGRHEVVDDGQPGVNSPFAAGLITYLKKNTERAVNTTNLVQYIKSYMEGKSRQTPVEGRIQNSVDEGGEFIFHLKLVEQDLWNNVREKDTLEAYEHYLDYFPSGQFVAQAQRRVLELGEEDVWKSALRKGNESAFENYLKKYVPHGRHVEDARRRLDALRRERTERQRQLEELAAISSERERIREQFDRLIGEAEQHFQQRDLGTARDRYQEAIRYHLDGFVPTLDYIDGQLTLCSNGLTFLQHFEHGQRAMQAKNYRLALEYFNEARKIDDNPKMEDLIRVCRQKLDGGSSADELLNEEYQPPTPPPPQPEDKRPAPPPKRKRGWRRIAAGLAAAVLLLSLIAYFAAPENDSYYPYVEPDLNQQGLYEPATPAPGNTPPEETTIAAEPAAPASYQQGILGAWQTTEILLDGASLTDSGAFGLGLSVVYQFYDNGYVTISGNFGTDNQAYYVNNQNGAITLQGLYYGNNGAITYLDEDQLSMEFYYNDGFSNHRLVLEMERVE